MTRGEILVAIGVTVGTPVAWFAIRALIRFAKKQAKKTKTTLDDELVDAIEDAADEAQGKGDTDV